MWKNPTDFIEIIVLNEIVASLRPTHVTKGTYKLLVITATEALTD